MTFVAHPYERFSDDLLTALTGGIIREEHRFTGQEFPYRLTVSDVLVPSLTVFGQRNDVYVVFEGGIDYTYQPGNEELSWVQGGRHPDSHSFFYVNYYRREANPKLSDRNPGSVTSVLAEAFARQYAVLPRQMEQIYQSAFVDSATGRSLDHVAALLAIERKDAKFASGEVLCKRNTPAPGDITIPSGTLVSTDQGLAFESTDKRTLRRGQLSVTVSIRAQVSGPVGRVQAGVIKILNRPIFGIDEVVNEKPTFFATEKETDQALRRRITTTLERSGKSTLNAIKYGLIDDVSEINETNIQIVERDEPGVVEVILGLENHDDPDLVRRIEAAIFRSRPAGVRVIHNLPSRSHIPSVEQGFTEQSDSSTMMPGDTSVSSTFSPPQDLLEKMLDGILQLQMDIRWEPLEKNLAVTQKEKIEDGLRLGVQNYVQALPMGAPVVYNKLLSLLVQPEEIRDAILRIGAKGGDLKHDSLGAEGRKPLIDVTDSQQFSIGLSIERVFLDFLVQLESNSGETQVSSDIQASVEKAIQKVVGNHTGTLMMASIRTEIAQVLKESNFEPHLVPASGLSMNAEYEDVGRVVIDAQEIFLESHHVSEIRKIKIEIPGELHA